MDDKREIRDQIVQSTPEISRIILRRSINQLGLQESFPKVIDFLQYTKYIIKIRLFAKSLPCFIDFDKSYPDHVYFFVKFGEDDPSLDDYDVRLTGESIRIDD